MDHPGPKMDRKTEGCLNNCVNRFIDANIAVTTNLDKKASQMLQSQDRE